jgi:hypothetical protein
MNTGVLDPFLHKRGDPGAERWHELGAAHVLGYGSVDGG